MPLSHWDCSLGPFSRGVSPSSSHWQLPRRIMSSSNSAEKEITVGIELKYALLKPVCLMLNDLLSPRPILALYNIACPQLSSVSDHSAGLRCLPTDLTMHLQLCTSSSACLHWIKTSSWYGSVSRRAHRCCISSCISVLPCM